MATETQEATAGAPSSAAPHPDPDPPGLTRLRGAFEFVQQTRPSRHPPPPRPHGAPLPRTRERDGIRKQASSRSPLRTACRRTDRPLAAVAEGGCLTHHLERDDGLSRPGGSFAPARRSKWPPPAAQSAANKMSCPGANVGQRARDLQGRSRSRRSLHSPACGVRLHLPGGHPARTRGAVVPIGGDPVAQHPARDVPGRPHGPHG